MPRRNLIILFSAILVGIFCHQRVQKNPYAKVLVGAMSRIESSYIEPVTPASLFEAAMNGMIGSLDEHSEYITPRQVKEFEETMNFEFGGVGIQVALDPHTKQLRVSVPLVGSPAQKAGIRAGDVILRIDGAATQGMSLQDAVALLRGKPGDPVTLTILRPGEESPHEIRLVRDKILIDTILGDVRNPDGSWNFFLEGQDHIGYIRIVSFTDNTAEDFRRTVAWLCSQKMRGLIIDLRDNPGGYVVAAVEICDMLIESGPIVSVRRRGGQIIETYTASNRPKFLDFPVAVIVNQESASAAEIVAACLQDHKRAVVVGQRTFGKGTIQELIDLERNCGKLKLTTAAYWRPSGKNIHRTRDADEKSAWGVSPDEGFDVSMKKDLQDQWRIWRANRDALQPSSDAEPFVDPQLQRAIEYINEKNQDKKH